jgi:glycosyltransferase involved in cell wall biosynthesis
MRSLASTLAPQAAPARRRRPSICFVAPSAYPVLADDRRVRFVGGAEVQQVAIATELARRGWHVSMISMDFGQNEGDTVRGVRMLKTYRPDAGAPVLRFLHPRLSSVWRALRRADADVYYQRAGGMLTGVVAAFARRHRRVSVFGAAHDHDFEPALPLIALGRDKAIYRWGVHRVDLVIAQSERQRERCRQTFGRDALRIDSAYAHVGRPAAREGVVLWVANGKRHKQPHRFVELAARLPEFRFRLVGGPVGSNDELAYYRQMADQARRLANLELTGYVPFAEVESQFDGAAVFVNTSVGEGFPNTFLQAWSRGMPTVSFFDPERRVDGEAVGVVVPDLDAMVDAVRRLKTAPAYWTREGDRCRRAFEAVNSLQTVADAYESAFDRAFGAALVGQSC